MTISHTLDKLQRRASLGSFKNPRTAGLYPWTPIANIPPGAANFDSVGIGTSSSAQSGVSNQYDAVLQQSPSNVLNPTSIFTWAGGYPYVNPNSGFGIGVSATRGSATGNVDSSNRLSLTWKVHFMTDATKISLCVLGYSKYRILIDDVYTDMAGFATPSSGGDQWINLEFGARAPEGRKITIETAGTTGFKRAFVDPLSSCWRVPQADRLRIGVIGDSIGAGTGAALEADGFATVIGDILGSDDVWLMTIGGTGYIANGSGGVTTATYGQHQSDWCSTQTGWDLLVFSGGNNDYGNSSADEQAAVAAVLAAARLANPNVPIIVLGPDACATGPDSALLAIEAGIAAAVAAMADPYCSFIPLANPSEGTPEIYGTGAVGFENGSGNSDIYVGWNGSDRTHPNEAGHRYRGFLRASRIRTALQVMNP